MLLYIFFITTTLAIIIGITVAIAIKPGSFVDANNLKITAQASSAYASPVQATAPTLSELPLQLVTLLPSNPLSSMVECQMLQVELFAMVTGVALVMMSAA